MLERKSLQSEAILLWVAAIDAAATILHACLSNCQGLVTTPRDRSRSPIDDLRSPTLPGSSIACRPPRRHIFSKDESNGTLARYRHPAAQGDEARLPRAHERRQSALHGEGQGIRVRLLGRRPPLRLWRLQVHRRALETGGAGLDRYLWTQGRIERARRRLRQGIPALRDEEDSAGTQDRRLRHLQTRPRRCPRRDQAASVPLS